jgi:hypothetical protein
MMDASILQQKTITMMDCDRMGASLGKDQCVRKVAEHDSNLVLCELIHDPIQKPICFNAVLRKHLLSKVCTDMKSEKMKANCQHATYTNLMELVQGCLRATDSKACMTKISHSSTGTDLCNLHEAGKKERCQKRFTGV